MTFEISFMKTKGYGILTMGELHTEFNVQPTITFSFRVAIIVFTVGQHRKCAKVVNKI